MKSSPFSPKNGAHNELSKRSENLTTKPVQETLRLPEKQSIPEFSLHEQSLILENPAFVGVNFDQDLIVDASKMWSGERYLQYVVERDGEISGEIQAALDEGKGPAFISNNEEIERRKSLEFMDHMSGFKGMLQHARVHPAGECSPIAPSQAIEIKPDGSYEIVIAPAFVDQVQVIREQAHDVTLVVQFYDHRRGKENASNVPETNEEVSQYINLCETIISQIGADIQLEIGNETNISRSTGAMFADKLQHATKVDSTAYGAFFFTVATKLKRRFPEIKLSMAGVALFDPTYVTKVLEQVERLKTKHNVGEALVDTISFHPYREDPEGGSVGIKDGAFAVCELNYEQQMDEMQHIADTYGVKLTVGEINFSLSDPEQKAKLKQAIALTTKREIESFIYPANNVH